MRLMGRPVSLIATLCIVFISLAPFCGKASARDVAQATEEPKPKPVTLTGCLDKGDEEGKVVLTTQDGTLYLLRSPSISLKGHVGHKVSLTGTFGEIRDDEDGSGEYRESGTKLLVVTGLKMISTKCQ